MAEAESAGPFSAIIDKFAFVNQLPMLNKATADDQYPTPGYMYPEITNITLTSGSYCHDLLDFLTERLDKKACNVKLKVLRILKHVIEHGHPEFRQGLRKRCHGLKEATKHNGPPDPLHGNAPYHMVRKTSKEVLEQLFSISDDDTQMPKTVPVVMKSTGGMGSSSIPDGKLQGFGNTAARPKTLGESIVDGLRDIADKVTDNRPQTGQPLLSADSNFGVYKPAQLDYTHQPEADVVGSDGVRDMPGHSLGKRTRTVRSHRPGVAGGGWEDEEEEAVLVTMATGGNEGKPASSCSGHSAASVSDSSERLENVRTDNHILELQLVNEFAHGIDTPLLTREDQSNFLKRSCSLNCDKVVEFISENLKQEDTGVLMKCMLLLECLMRSDLVGVDSLAAVCEQPLVTMFTAHTPGTPCHNKARKIIRQLEKLCPRSDIFKDIPPAPSKNAKQSTGVLNNSHKNGQNKIIETANLIQDISATRSVAAHQSLASPESSDSTISEGFLKVPLKTQIDSDNDYLMDNNQTVNEM